MASPNVDSPGASAPSASSALPSYPAGFCLGPVPPPNLGLPPPPSRIHCAYIGLGSEDHLRKLPFCQPSQHWALPPLWTFTLGRDQVSSVMMSPFSIK